MLRTVLRQGPAGWAFLASVCLVAAAQEATIRWLRLPVACRLAGAELQLDPSSRQGARPHRGAGTPTVPSPDDGPVPVAGGEDGWDLLSDRERRRCETALTVLDRGPFNATCLRRSLMLAHLLRRRGPVVRVGVAKRGETVQAHAWVEIHGRTLDPEREEYAVLAPAGGPDPTRTDPTRADASHAELAGADTPRAELTSDLTSAGGSAA